MATKELQNVTKKKLVVLSGAGISAELEFPICVIDPNFVKHKMHLD